MPPTRATNDLVFHEEDAEREKAHQAEQEKLKHESELRARKYEKEILPRRFKAMREERPRRLEQAKLAAERTQALRQLAEEEAIACQLEVNIVKTRFAIQRQGVMGRFRGLGLNDD